MIAMMTGAPSMTPASQPQSVMFYPYAHQVTSPHLGSAHNCWLDWPKVDYAHRSDQGGEKTYVVPSISRVRVANAKGLAEFLRDMDATVSGLDSPAIH